MKDSILKTNFRFRKYPSTWAINDKCIDKFSFNKFTLKDIDRSRQKRDFKLEANKTKENPSIYVKTTMKSKNIISTFSFDNFDFSLVASKFYKKLKFAEITF